MAGLQPDIIHVHEWQLSAVPMLYWEHYHKQGLARPRVMLTIHNMDSSGECRQDEFAYSGRYSSGSVPHALPAAAAAAQGSCQRHPPSSVCSEHVALGLGALWDWRGAGRKPSALLCRMSHSVALLHGLAAGSRWVGSRISTCVCCCHGSGDRMYGRREPDCSPLLDTCPPSALPWLQGSQERCLPRRTKRWTSEPSATTLSACLS